MKKWELIYLNNGVGIVYNGRLIVQQHDDPEKAEALLRLVVDANFGAEIPLSSDKSSAPAPAEMRTADYATCLGAGTAANVRAKTIDQVADAALNRLFPSAVEELDEVHDILMGEIGRLASIRVSDRHAIYTSIRALLQAAGEVDDCRCAEEDSASVRTAEKAAIEKALASAGVVGMDGVPREAKP